MTSPADIARLANRALAATATAYLSGAGGTRYGAAVLTASGRIFEAGQYSSFNHQTGVHAEQAAILAAVAAGHPDVLALAIAATKAREFTRPCGTCRQIILEHAARCGRSIDVVMVGPEGSCEVRPIEALLPDSWLPASAPGGRDRGTRMRQGEPHAPRTLGRLGAGDQVLVGDRLIALVWDPLFMPGLALVKPKYLRQPDGWAKVPHSLTESALHDAFRQRHGLDHEVAPGVWLPVVASTSEWTGWPAVPITEFTATAAESAVQDGIGSSLRIPAEAAFVSGSLATGLHAGPDSDLDLVVRADRPTAAGIRAGIARGILAGTIAVEEASRSLQLVTALFGGRPGQLVSEGRYAESLRVGDRPVSVMYALEEHAAPAVMPGGEPWQRGCAHGVVVGAGEALGKRSSWQLRCDDGPLHVVCYHRGGSLVREGDRLSVSGWLTSGADGRRMLVQVAVHRDTIAWFHAS